MRSRTSLLLVLAAVLTSGCLRSTTTIALKPDGSGTIVQETAVGAQAMAMLKSFAADQKPAAAEMFSEEQARKTGEAMGVTFVSGEPIKTPGLEGYRATYRFDDITKIKVNMQQADAVAGTQKQPPFGFTLARGAASTVLTVQMPEQNPELGALPGLSRPPGAAQPDKAESAQALAMMKVMLAGMFVDVSLDVDGRIIKTNAPHVEGSKITLLQVDFDKLMQDAGGLERLEGAKDLKALANIPGLKVATEPTLVIEFSR